jgi:hypothetical protein
MTNRKTFGRTLFATVMMIGLMGTFAATAHADEWRDHERDAREWHHRHHMHDHDRPIVVQQPNVVYAPPLVVEAPSSGSSGGLNITIPLNFN